MHTVALARRKWQRSGHGGLTDEVDYTIFLNDVRLRGYSTHGNMSEGYWGRAAEKMAEDYAQSVADTIGVRVVNVTLK